jgi:AraC-like DNA-binding protein
MQEANVLANGSKDFKYNRLTAPGIQVIFNKLVFNDMEAPINLWLLESSDDIQAADFLHAHEYIQICCVSKGSIINCFDNYKYVMAKGDLFVIPPQKPHFLEKVDDNRLLVYELEFDPSFINSSFSGNYFNSGIFDFAYIEPFLSSENNIKPRLNISGEIQDKIETLLQEMVEEIHNKEEGYKQLLKANLLKLLILIGREYASSEMPGTENSCLHKKYMNAVSYSIEFINGNFAQDLRLEDICKYAMMSQAYFSSMFKQLTKMTFTEYINNLRIKKAMEILRKSSEKITDICYDTGFNEVSHFNRVFKKYSGFAPSAYRKIFSEK